MRAAALLLVLVASGAFAAPSTHTEDNLQHIFPGGIGLPGPLQATCNDIIPPATPKTGEVLYCKAGSGWCAKDALGTERCTGAGGAGGYANIIDDLGPLPPETTLSFLGAGVTCVDNPGVSTDCTIPGASGGHIIQDESVDRPAEARLNFLGAGVSCIDNAGVSTDCTIAGTAFLGALLNATIFNDVVANPPVQGDLITANATPKWDKLAIGVAQQALHVNAGATAPQWGILQCGGGGTGGADAGGGVTTCAKGFDHLSPLSGKGQLIGWQTAVDHGQALAAGVNGETLHAQSAQTLGLQWSKVDLADTTQVTGSPATCSALAADPANCPANQAAGGITAAGVAESCVSAGHIIQDESVDRAVEPRLNFLGAGINCVDNAAVSTDCTVAGTSFNGHFMNTTLFDDVVAHTATGVGNMISVSPAAKWDLVVNDTTDTRKFLSTLSIAGDAQFPTWKEIVLGTDTSGNYAGSASEAGPATTALALNADPANCGANLAAGGITAAGVAEACVTPLLSPGAVTTNALVKFNGVGGQVTAQSACIEAAGVLSGCTAPAVAHNLLSATHGDTLADTPVKGDVLVGNATPKWARLPGDTTNTQKFLSMLSVAGVAPVPSWKEITLGTDTAGNYVSGITANQGIALTGTEGATVGLIDCAENEILKSTGAGGTSWTCQADATSAGAGISAVQEDDADVSNPATTLDFTEPDAVLVTNAPAGEANIAMNKYTLLAGRSGGQVIDGGTLASNNLTLTSTAHATKGSIFLTDSTRIGDTSTPSARLEVTAPAGINAKNNIFAVEFTGTNAAAPFYPIRLLPSGFSQSDLTNTEMINMDSTVTCTADSAATCIGPGNPRPCCTAPGVGALCGIGCGHIMMGYIPKLKNATNAASAANINFGYSFRPTISVDGGTYAFSSSEGGVYGFWGHPLLQREAGAGSGTVDRYSTVLSHGTVNAGWAITDTWAGLWMKNPAGTVGTIATLAGVDIDSLTRGTTNISLRSTGAQTMRHEGNVRLGDTATAPTQKLEVLGHVFLDNAGTASELRLREPSASGSDYTAFKATTQAGNVVYTLPPDDGDAGEQLQSNGSGVLTWENPQGTANLPTFIDLPAASCVSTVAYSNWDLLGADIPVAACLSGTNTVVGVLDFDDGTTGTTPGAQQAFILGSNWIEGSGIVVDLKWKGVNTTNAVRWCAQVVCVADAETDDPAFDTAICVNDTAKGTTLQTNDVTITLTGTSVDTCAANELLHLKVFRDSDNGGDTFVGNARLLSARVTLYHTP